MPDEEMPRWLELLRERLDEDLAALVEDAVGENPTELDPLGLVNLMRELDSEDERQRGVSVLAEKLAEADTLSFVERWFATTRGWRLVPERSGALGLGAVGVEWVFLGRHDEAHDRSLHGIAATGRSVRVHGLTVFGVEGGNEFRVYRHIDWAGLYAQLGLTLNTRVPTDPDNAHYALMGDAEPDDGESGA